jgi:hypothetical protein
LKKAFKRGLACAAIVVVLGGIVLYRMSQTVWNYEICPPVSFRDFVFERLEGEWYGQYDDGGVMLMLHSGRGRLIVVGGQRVQRWGVLVTQGSFDGTAEVELVGELGERGSARIQFDRDYRGFSLVRPGDKSLLRMEPHRSTLDDKLLERLDRESGAGRPAEQQRR